MQEFLLSIVKSFEFEACIRLLLGGILAGIIGHEREAWKKPAGTRTHILVGESAVLIMLCGIYISKVSQQADPSRIPAQLLSGIGFIGAGTILRDGFQVKGLTTAASLLAVTAIGLIIGAGAYVIGIVATLVVYGILSYTHIISESSEKYNEFEYVIDLENPKSRIKEIEELFDTDDIMLKSIKIDEQKIVIKGKHSDNLNTSKLISNLMNIDEVIEVTENKN